MNNLEARGGIEPPMRVLQTHALPLGYRAKLFKSGYRSVPPKQKTHLPAFWWWVALSSEAATGFYPLSLPTPEDTRLPHIQRPHIREFFRGLLNMRVE